MLVKVMPNLEDSFMQQWENSKMRRNEKNHLKLLKEIFYISVSVIIHTFRKTKITTQPEN